MARLRWLGGFFVCIALSSPAQDGPPPTALSAQPALAPPVALIPRSHEDRERRSRVQHRVLLSVQVSDASGKPVTGLAQQDFTLTEDGKPQILSSFQAMKGGAELAPAHVILLLDTVNNTPRSIAVERRQIERFLAESPARLAYPASVGVFSGSGARVGQPSRDRDALAAEFRALAAGVRAFECGEEGVGSGKEFAATLFGPGALTSSSLDSGLQSAHPDDCLNQRFRLSVFALNKLAREQMDAPGRAILIWIGPGWPLLSGHGFSADTPSLRRTFFDYLVDLSTNLREAQVTLDAVSSPDIFRVPEARSDHDTALFDGVPGEDQVTAASLSLDALAHQSGGRTLSESKDLAAEIARCIGDAEAYYLLSFDSVPSSRQGEFHSLRVLVNRPGATARTSTGYYAQP